MPRNHKAPPVREATPAELLAAREEFEDGFTANPNGNFVRCIDGVRLVVYRREGLWRWLIDNGIDPPRHSPEPCPDVSCLIGDLWRVWTGSI